MEVLSIMPIKKRVRRAPEEAKALILQAALKVISEKGPDGAGLKDVGKAAGVSHGLVTHYFGTWDELVYKALEHRAEQGRLLAEATVAVSPPGPEEVLQFLVAYLSDPLQVRLITWALLTGKDEALLPLSVGALKPIFDSILERRRQQFGKRKNDAVQTELDVTVSLAAGFGFALGQKLFARALNRPPLAPEVFAHRLSRMLQAAIAADGDP